MSHDPQSPTDAADFEDDYLDTDDCPDCSGEGGYNSCPESTCVAIGGEDGCIDPVCWAVCPNCRGTGII